MASAKVAAVRPVTQRPTESARERERVSDTEKRGDRERKGQ